MLISINPATEETVAEYPKHHDDDINAILEQGDSAFAEWKREPIGRRAGLMRKAAAALQDGREEFAALMAREMGKPVRQGRAEIDKCALVCEYYAEHGAAFLEDEPVQTEAGRSRVCFQPLGVVLAVMPWNFPFWQVFRFAAPALTAGNAGVLKHASNVTGCALAIERVFREAGFPEHLFQVLKIGSDKVKAVIENPVVRAVTLTGSGAAGKSVAETAGRALKKSVLELGGSDPYVILEDADLGHAVSTCVNSRLINGGQSCIAAKRFIVVKPLKAEFEKRFVAEMRNRKMADPMDEEADLGPLARVDLRDELHRQVEESVSKGAECLLGGVVPDREGAWYPPTVLTDVLAGMPAHDDELFGPVAAIIEAGDEAHAIRIANYSPYGLGAAVFTRDLEKGERIAREELAAGCCFVNDLVKSDPRLPFGGIKESGYGRELSHYGIKEFVNIKTVSIA